MKKERWRKAERDKQEVQWAESSSSSGLSAAGGWFGYTLSHSNKLLKFASHAIFIQSRYRYSSNLNICCITRITVKRQLLLYPRLQNSCVCAVHLCCKCVERTTTLTLRFSLLDTWRLNTPHGHEMESTNVTLWFNPKVIFNVWHISLCL